MNVIFDIEANGYNPTKIWVIICKDFDTGEVNVFRRPSDDDSEKNRFLEYSRGVKTWIGHNILGYDLPALVRILGQTNPDIDCVIDTYICSKLIDYPRDGHSIENYGEEFSFPKIDHKDFSTYTVELEEYCRRDVEIAEKIYKKYYKYISNVEHRLSINLEQRFYALCRDMESYGFYVDSKKILRLLDKVSTELKVLDTDIQQTFLPKLKYIRTITPKATKYGTISLSNIPKTLRSNIHELGVDCSFDYCEWVEFNPSSPKQIVEVLNQAGWKPTVKTKTHIETERRIRQLDKMRRRGPELDGELQTLKNKLNHLSTYGWKVNEENLSTLPDTAPKSARVLAKRILYEARRRTLKEWSELVGDDNRIHGKFQSIGAWTHRMSHQHPNMANVTNEFDTNGKVKLLGKELRQCWTVPKNRLLVGVDAEGIQLRIFAHLVNDPSLIKALVEGKKSDKTDPHSLNKRIIGDTCKTRQAAKRFIYALFLGGGLPKLAEILETSLSEAKEAVDRVMRQYSRWQSLKEFEIPRDSRRGWFTGVDGRRVRILGDTQSEREHLWMSGQLQNGEKVIIATAAVAAAPLIKQYDAHFVDIVHDEYQVECPNDFTVALEVAKILDNQIRMAGVNLGLNCPLAGSYWNDDHHEYTIGRNWYETH